MEGEAIALILLFGAIAFRIAYRPFESTPELPESQENKEESMVPVDIVQAIIHRLLIAESNIEIMRRQIAHELKDREHQSLLRREIESVRDPDYYEKKIRVQEAEIDHLKFRLNEATTLRPGEKIITTSALKRSFPPGFLGAEGPQTKRMSDGFLASYTTCGRCGTLIPPHWSICAGCAD